MFSVLTSHSYASAHCATSHRIELGDPTRRRITMRFYEQHNVIVAFLFNFLSQLHYHRLLYFNIQKYIIWHLFAEAEVNIVK